MLKAGDRIGDWDVQELLGEGGMGAVFRCTNAMSDRILAAVKVIRPERLDDARERFIREVEALYSLRHPAVVRVHSWGQDSERGLLWMAMELVEGQELAELVSGRPLERTRIAPVFGSVAEGLLHAHERGVFHRDLKPSNLLVVPSGQGVLIDWGIAAHEGRTRLTGKGLAVGTPAYMAPEVFDGPRSDPALIDVYALGQVLFEALTGREAFPSEPELSTGQQVVRIMGAKLAGRPLDPGEAASPGLRDLVLRSTEADPTRRLPDMASFVDLLRDATSGTSWTTWLSTTPDLAAQPAPPSHLRTPDTWLDVSEHDDAPPPPPQGPTVRPRTGRPSTDLGPPADEGEVSPEAAPRRRRPWRVALLVAVVVVLVVGLGLGGGALLAGALGVAFLVPPGPTTDTDVLRELLDDPSLPDAGTFDPFASDEQLAGLLLQDMHASLDRFDYDAASKKAGELVLTYPHTQVGERAAREQREIAVIGRAAGELDVEHWYRGRAAMNGGEVTLLVFFESGCAMSADQAPKTEEIHRRLSARGLNVIGVTPVYSEADDEDVQRFIQDHGLSYPVARDRSGSMAERFRVTATPDGVVVVGGEVVWRGHPGRVTDELFELALGRR